MKRLFILLLLFVSFKVEAQSGYKSTRNNGVNMTTEDYVINSPGNTPGNSATTARYKDSTYIQWLFANAYFANLPNTVNNGNPVNFLHTASDGRVLSSSISWLAPDSNNIFSTKYYLGQNFYTKAQSDMRYLQSFSIDSQMVVNAIGGATWTYLLNKYTLPPGGNSSQYLNGLGNLITFPTIPTNTNQLTNGANFISSYTETDPLFDTKFSGKTTTNLTEGTNLYWTSARFSSSFSTALTNSAIVSALTYTPYNGSSNPLGFVTSSSLTTTLGGYATSSALTAGLATKFNQPAGTTLQYVRGDGNLATLPIQYIPTIHNNVSRPIDSTTFTISTTLQAYVSYPIRISTTATIGSNQSANVYLQYSTDAGSTWNNAGIVENSNTVTLAIVLNQVSVQTCGLSGWIPANALCRIAVVKTGTLANTTVTNRNGQELY